MGYEPLVSYSTDGSAYEAMPSEGSHFNISKTKLLIGVLAAAVLVVIIITLAVTLSRSSGPIGTPLPATRAGELWVAETPSRIVARSYDALSWEAMPNADEIPWPVSCGSDSSDSCAIVHDEPFTLRQLPVPDSLKNVSPESLFARLMMQASFGATQEELSAPVDAPTWVEQQMALPPSLLRSYVRERTNPRSRASAGFGDIRDICEVGARWHKAAFNYLDIAKDLTVSVGPTSFILTMDGGVVRTEISVFLGDHFVNRTGTYPWTAPFCVIDDRLGAGLTLALPGGNCFGKKVSMNNPPIVLSGNTNSNFRQTPTDADFILEPTGAGRGSMIATRFNKCNSQKKSGILAYARFQNNWYRFDPRLKSVDNTLDNPADGVNSIDTCPSAVKTFVNDGTCTRRPSCSPPTFSSRPVKLNDASLKAWYDRSNLYIYYITGLRLESFYAKTPCRGSSRWVRTAGACAGGDTALDAKTKATIVTALSTSTDKNPFVRDIVLPGVNCTGAIGAKVSVGGECFQHTHPEEFSVRDFTRWTVIHPGNDLAFKQKRANPIAKWAESGLVNLPFPANHPISRLSAANLKVFPLIGRYGDTIDFQELSTNLQTLPIAEYFGAAVQQGQGGGFESCGSPGEVGNNATLGHRYVLYNTPEHSDILTSQLDWGYPLSSGKRMAWTNVVLKAPDQFRQRIAWALQQIFTIADNGGLINPFSSETWAVFYDIFIRHAFGNYRDILKEVTYSPMMGEYLTYFQSRSFAVTKTFPDENYAREIMQLFSIGLYELNDDGSTVVQDGQFLDSYTDEHIVEFSRVWTGFDRQPGRGNIETSRVDPMQVRPAWHDWFPKVSLDPNGYLGDHYPLCADRPPHHWLRPGAKFVYTGTVSAEGAEMDAQDPVTFKNRGRFAPEPSSELYQKLCAATAVAGPCTFPSVVELTTVLPCTSIECLPERITTVTIRNGATTAYYTYLEKPCVKLTYFDEGRLLKNAKQLQCGDPALPIGSPACCAKEDSGALASTSDTQGLCLFGNEQTVWSTSKARCEAVGLAVCNAAEKNVPETSWSNSCASSVMHWTHAPCRVQVQILPSGECMLVDQNSSSLHLQESSGNKFRVRWADGKFPDATGEAGCGSSCRLVETDEDDTCVCDVQVVDRPVFGFDEAKLFPNAWEVASRCKIGAPDPSTFEEGTYSVVSRRPDVKMWVKAGTVWTNMTTIFEIGPKLAGGETRFLLNRESRVVIVAQTELSFRNPPAFLPLFGEAPLAYHPWRSAAMLLPQCESEIDSLLDHLFEHNNTAPFVATRLIQRLVTSNPSPRYVKSVVDAFRSGTYKGKTYSGRYGDMAAASVAVLLDQEARSPVLEADPAFGVLREPLLKLLHLARSLKFETIDGRETLFAYTMDKLGQAVFDQGTVFGFYFPDFRPSGPLSDRRLVSPEAQISITPYLVKFFNGVTSLIDHGLTRCLGGFGHGFGTGNNFCKKAPYADVEGFLTHMPPADATPASVISNLNLLLTANRLNASIANFFEAEYTRVLEASNADNAFKYALKMFLTSLEFHSTNANILSNTPREANALSAGAGRKYKAVVVIFLYGGADSFNLVVPHSKCTGGKDYYKEYKDIRKGAAYELKDLLPITVPAGQPCTQFAVSNNMPNLKGLYDDGHASFVINTGCMVEPLTKAEYLNHRKGKKQVPPSPTAHNIGSRSASTVHAQEANAKGILGRTIDSLNKLETPFKSEMYSITGSSRILTAASQPADIIDSRGGVIDFLQLGSLRHVIQNVTKFKSESAFAETFAGIMDTSVRKTETIGNFLKDTTTATKFGTSSLSKQLNQVAKLIKMRTELGTERAVFSTGFHGWDSHFTFSPPWRTLDSALGEFASEMKAQGTWDDVVVLTVSDFGRTLIPNGVGTDHAWAGNYFMAGGSLKGGKFHGKYPDSLLQSGDANYGQRGRLVPSSGWESLWHPVCKWMGVPDEQMSTVLPNLKYWPADKLFTDVFKN